MAFKQNLHFNQGSGSGIRISIADPIPHNALSDESTPPQHILSGAVVMPSMARPVMPTA